MAQAALGNQFTSILASAKKLTTQYGNSMTAQKHPTTIKFICADGTIDVPKEIAATLGFFKSHAHFQKNSRRTETTFNLKKIADGISTPECQYLFDYIQNNNIDTIPDGSLVAVFYAADYLCAPEKLIQALAQKCLDVCDITTTNHPDLYVTLTSHTKSVESAKPTSACGILDLSNQGLTNLDNLNYYALDQITTLDVSNNALIALDLENILKCLPHLNKINARNNMLSNTPDIKAIRKLLRPTRITRMINDYHVPVVDFLGMASSCYVLLLINANLNLNYYQAPISIALAAITVMVELNNNKFAPYLKQFMPTKIMYDKKVTMNDLD